MVVSSTDCTSSTNVDTNTETNKDTNTNTCKDTYTNTNTAGSHVIQVSIRIHYRENGKNRSGKADDSVHPYALSSNGEPQMAISLGATIMLCSSQMVVRRDENLDSGCFW